MIRIIIILCVLIFALAFYVIANNENTVAFNNHTETHVLVVTTANEISSYVKRAEGHILMYLMLRREIDRRKFYARMESLKENISSLTSLQNTNYNKEHAQNLLSLHGKALISANALLQHFDKSISNTSNFNFKQSKNISMINAFHELTSEMRQKAVSMVKLSANLLEIEHNTIRKSLRNEKRIIFITALICFGLLSLVIVLFKKMSRLSQKLHKFSYTDSLTGIANRRKFEEKFDLEWQRSLREKSSLALMLIDVDSFKQVNDKHGHSAGDICLTNIAKTLQSCLKRPTDIIARYGGEEFAIILPNTTKAKLLAEQCCASVNEMDSPIDGIKKLSITIGVGIFNVTPELEKSSVIQKIDQALYHGKSIGKNRVETVIIQ